MSQQIINTGTEPGAGDGDDLYTAFDKVNQNFTEIYSGNVLAANIVVYSVAGRTGNVELSVQDVLGAASTGNITSLQVQMAANSAADRAYTNAAVASLSSVSNINITGGTLSNVHITGHSWGNLANLNVLGSITASGSLTANGISSTDNIVATNDINVGGVLRFADLTEMSTAVAPVNLTSTNLAIVTNTNRVAAANVQIAALRANITAANSEIVTNTNRVTAANLELAALRANVTAANAAIVIAASNSSSNAAVQSLAIASINANVVAANAAIVQNTNSVSAANVEINALRANIIAANTSMNSNAAVQAAAIDAINANVTAANAAISSLESNAAVQAADISTLTSNAATQSADIASLQANISAANAAISSGADRLVNGANELVLHANANVTVPSGMHFIAPEDSNISIRSTGTLGNTHIEWHDAADRATVKYSKDGVEVFTTSAGVQRSWKFHPDGSTHFPQYVFPLGPGTAGQYLETDGLGVLTWVDPTPSDLTSVNANVTAANAAIAALQSNASTQSVEIAQLQSNIIAANSVINTLTSNAATQAVEINQLRSNIIAANSVINTLTSNAAGQQTTINSINANVSAANAAIAVLQSNALSQAVTLNSLEANTITQESRIILVNANVTAANAEIASIKANAATNAALAANAAVQALLIDDLRANVTATNVRVTDTETTVSLHSQQINTLSTNAAVQQSLIVARATIANPTFTGTVTTPALTVTGNATVGNISTTKITATEIQGNLVNIPSITASNISAININSTNGTFTNIEGTLTTSAQPNITTVGTLDQLDVDGNVTADRVITNEIHGTLYSGPQPGITRTGTLGNLTVTGNIVTEGNTVRANTVQANNLSTSGNVTVGGNLILSGCLTISGSSVTLSAADIRSTTLFSEVANFYWLTANAASFPGNLSAGNITSNGSLIASSLTVPTIVSLGNSTIGNIQTNSVTATNLTGTLLTAAQPNITSVGTLSALNVNGAVGITGNAIISNNLYVTGNLFVAGNQTTVNSESVTTNELTLTLANGAPTGAATNGSGVFVAVANAAITYDYTSDSWVLNKNLVVSNVNAGNVTGTLTTASQPNITTVGTLGALSVTGNVSSGNVITTRADLTSVRFSDNTVQTTAANVAIEAYLISVNANTAAANVEINSLRGNITAANVEINSLRGNISAANVEIGNVQANVTAANTEIGYLQGNISSANLEIGNLQGNISAANLEIGNLQGNISAANLEIGYLQANVTAANIEIGNLQGNISAANIEIGYLQANVTAANIEIGNLQGNVSAANIEIGNLQGNVSAANIEIGNLQGNISAANIEIGNLQGDISAANSEILLRANIASPTFTGNLNANIIFATGNVTVGNISGAKAEFSELVVPSITFAGNVTGGNIITSGNLNVNSIIASGNITSSAYVNGQSGNFVFVYGQVETQNQPQINQLGTLVDLDITGNINSVSWVIASGEGQFSAVTGTVKTNAQPFINSVGTLSDLAVTGNVTTGNVSGNTAVFTEVTGTVLTNAQPYITSVGTLLSLGVTGNISSANLNTGNITATGNIVTTANLYAASLNLTGGFFLDGNLLASNLIVGNVSSIGNIVAEQDIIALGNLRSNNLTVSNTITAAGINITGGAGQINLGTGTLSAGQLIGNIAAGNILVYGIAPSFSTNTGAIVVSGGVGIAENLNVGFDADFGRDAVVNRDLYVLGNANIGTPVGTTNLFGDINFQGVTIESDNSAIAIFTTTVNQIEFGLAAQDIEIGALTGNTQINHDLIVLGNIRGNLGNASPDSNIVVGSNLTVQNFAIANNAVISNANVTTRLSIDNTLASLNTESGALTVAGGMGVMKNINVGTPGVANSNIIIYGTTVSTNTTTGALQVRGGTGLAGNLNVGGFANVSNTSAATSTTTGALRVAGGTGIAGNLYVGEDVTITGNFTVFGTPTLPTVSLASLNNTPVGNSIPRSGAFTTLGLDEAFLKPNLRPTLNLDFANGKKLEGRISYTGSTNGTYVNSLGVLLETESASWPRLHHDSDGQCLGVLIEEQRTNIVRYSEQFEQANSAVGWTTLEAFVTPASTTGSIGPRGATTGASQLKENNATDIHGISINSAELTTLTLATAYTASVFARKGTRDQIALIFEGEGTPTVFDLTFGNVTSEGTTYRSSIETLANGWYRCFSTVTKTNTSGNLIIAMVSGGATTYAGDGTSTLEIFGAQIEDNSFGTSYIKTTTGSATRNADNMEVSSTYLNTYFNRPQGTIFVDGTISYRPTDLVVQNTRGVFFSLEDSSVNNRIQVLAETKSAPVPFRSANLVAITSGAIQSNIGQQGNLATTISGKISAYFSNNNFGFSFNANTAQTDITGNVAPITHLKIGRGSGGNYLNGCVSKIQFYPQAASGSELENLTRQ